MAPLVSQLRGRWLGRGAMRFPGARRSRPASSSRGAEGIVPAPESNHAIASPSTRRSTRARRGHEARDPLQPVRATAISTCPPTSRYLAGSSRTSSTAPIARKEAWSQPSQAWSARAGRLAPSGQPVDREETANVRTALWQRRTSWFVLGPRADVPGGLDFAGVRRSAVRALPGGDRAEGQFRPRGRGGGDPS